MINDSPCSSGIELDTIDRLTGGRIGMFDVPCPVCGPEKRSANRNRKVLRVWRNDPGFASYCCARCGEKGHTRDRAAAPPDAAKLARVRAAAAQREQVAAIDRLGRARWLWSQRKAITGSIAETYLRQARGYGGGLPATLGFLPARGKHGPAMIAAFGLPTEPEPGLLEIENNAVRGVHITRLRQDGGGKAGTTVDKIMIGTTSIGSPIVLAPPVTFGLAITEGIEDALSAHETTGLGAWAAGSASRLPALADAVPDYIEAATIMVDDDDTGQRHAGELAARLTDRNIEVRLILPNKRQATRS
jgi:hypothetical protein